jgi:phospholipid/cholesterol/gamma-HCH transport system substrate-binding protein
VIALLRRLHDRSFNDVNPMLLGAISIVAIFSLIAGAFAVGTLGLLKHRYEMSGVFNDSSGLRNGDTVRVAGIDVGEVSAVTPDYDHGQVIVTWEVDDNVHLGRDTTAEIAVATLLGGMYVRLASPINRATGKVDRPYIDTLSTAERRIPLERTKTPATVAQVLDNATRAVEQINVTDVNKLLDQLGDLTLDNGQDVGTLAKDLATVSAAINQRKDQLDQLLTNTQQITDTLATRDTELQSLVDNASKLLDVIAQRRDELAQLFGSGAAVVTTLSNLITGHRTQLQAILDDLHATLAVTDAHLPQLDQSLAFLGPTFARVSTISHHGPWLDAVADSIPGADLLGILQGLGP